MLLQRNATVTIAHSRTVDLPNLLREADIVVAAVGRAEMVKGDWIKAGAIVIDAGYNKVEGRSGDVGDVHFESAKMVASWITPVPGGDGPMTVASLLSNCVPAATRRSVAAASRPEPLHQQLQRRDGNLGRYHFRMTAPARRAGGTAVIVRRTHRFAG